MSTAFVSQNPAARPFRWALSLAIAAATSCLAGDDQQAGWPRFRGPGGSGVYAGEVPVTCDVKTGENIAWKVDVPAPGFGSPVVWGDHVFLSGGDARHCAVMCFDTATGRLLWQKDVPRAEGAKGVVPDECGMAAATVATDGQRVYAMFANGDLGALSFDGSLVWTKHLAFPKNPYGHATSLLTWQDRVIVQFDQGQADDKLSKLYAFDGATGKVVWEQPRPAGASWATPIAFEAAGKSQLVTLAVPWVISYAAKDGAELWRAELLDGEVTPSPVFAGGTLLVVSPTIKLQSIRPDGKGDVTKTHLGWMAEDGIPDVTSPVSSGELVFLVDSSGQLTCYDAKTGRKQWEQDLSEECRASPSIAGGKLYVITNKGTVIVAAAGREFEELGRSALGEAVFASPAFAPNKMLVRGQKHLICVGAR